MTEHKEETEKPVYIHYGSKKFIPDNIYDVCDSIMNKPDFGLWASRVDAEFCWKDWCEDSDFRICNLSDSFKFTLKDDAKVMHISGDSIPDVLKPYCVSRDNWHKMLKNNPNAKRIDFNSIIADGYDAIEFEYSNTSSWNCRENRFSELYDLMYGWNCDSIVILNSDVVEIIEENKTNEI